MAKHDLGGASVDVVGVDGIFSNPALHFEQFQNQKFLKFTDPLHTSPSATIKFRFIAQGVGQNFLFGIKQLVFHVSHSGFYVGNKNIDGSLVEGSTDFNDRLFLDISPTSLTVLFDSRDLPTGAVAVAAHAPFYSSLPAAVRAGQQVELSIVDAPGGTFQLERQNPSTDRPNFLIEAGFTSEFLTALVVVLPNKTHVPLEALRWRQKARARVSWLNGTPSLINETSPPFVLERVTDISNVNERALLSNPTLRAADTIVAKFNDALFTVDGMFKRQPLVTPNGTGQPNTVEAKGYSIQQFVTAAGVQGLNPRIVNLP